MTITPDAPTMSAAEFYASLPTVVPQIEHPKICAEPWCLTRPSIAADGRVSSWNGVHRGDVAVITADFGTVVEVATARTHDFGVNGYGDPEIHVLLREVEGSTERFEMFLKPDEARRLARELTEFADFIEQHPRDVYEDHEMPAPTETAGCVTGCTNNAGPGHTGACVRRP